MAAEPLLNQVKLAIPQPEPITVGGEVGALQEVEAEDVVVELLRLFCVLTNACYVIHPADEAAAVGQTLVLGWRSVHREKSESGVRRRCCRKLQLMRCVDYPNATM